MVAYIRSDLDFILEQIKIAEAHAAGQPLYGPGGLVPAYTLSMGLRTVDGSYNNLLPGQEMWGAADMPFPELLDPSYRPADGTLFDPDGPGPAPAMPTSPNYNPSNNPNSLVFDSSLRTISNLIVDQTLGNPAAIMKALQMGGVATADMATVAQVQVIYNAFKPFADAEYQARVVAQNDLAAANALSDGNANTPPSAAEQAALATAAQSAAAHAVKVAELEAARVPRDAALAAFGIEMDGDDLHLPNVAPDAGLSAPFNSWFTLFGQFFDHGLDLVNKGGSGTVFIPLKPDDPLYVPGSHTNFMVLTRATVSAGADGVMGTADDVRPVNTTTPFVDQNQTYTSHSSHQVFLRQYVSTPNGPVATGKLIEGGGAAAGGMATWGEVKAQALLLGIQLTDLDVGNVPLLRTDQYGNFIPGPGGFAQVIIGIGPDGIPNTADDIVVSGTPNAPVNPTTVGALRIGHAFLADIAHDAVPNGLADGDIEIGLANPGNGLAVYDNELLDAHFIAGDGRANENIGLTAVHSIFHSEHNRLVDHTKSVVIADAAAMLANGATQAQAVAFLNEWLAVDVATVPVGAAVTNLVWDGERLFQAAKFGTEMQYQHLVFEDFARKIQPNIDFFVVPDGYHADINPSIVAEFAHVVYRFGHSMLTETIDRLDPSFNPDQIGLIEAFLNPIEFDAGHTVADGVAAGDIIRGMTRQVGNEIDEFVTGALRNNLLGLPLDLATINLARGRDAGVPSLNAARREFYEVSSHAAELKPYDSWVEFAGNLKNEASVINFIAAYGLHPLITGESTIEGKRAAAMAIIFGVSQSIADNPNTPANEARVIAVPTDAVDFLNGTGTWSNTAGGITTTGLDNIDLWIGGLAEKILPFGGMLGSTFNFVFEVQLEKLQDGDRFYYLQRLDGLHLLSEMENNTFAKLISLNADAGHLPSDVFSTPGLILEVDRTKQYNPGLGEAAGADGILADNPNTLVDESADNLGNDPVGGGILTPLVVRDNPATPGADANYLKYSGAEHVLLGGTEGNDILIASEGDDTLYGDGGNDRLEGGAGNDAYIGGDGDDIITDLFGDDIIRSGRGNDVINAGAGVDLVVGDEGQDFIVLGTDLLDEAFGGVGNDFIMGSKTTEQSMGGEGDDWIEIGAWTGAVGDNFDDQFARDAVTGHDVFHGDGGFDEFIGEGGDDIWFGSLGRGKFDGMSGFDWTTYSDMQFGVDADLNRLAFDANPLPPPNAALDTFSFVEGLSGSAFDDLIYGSDVTAADMPTEGFRGSVLNAAGIALINGLQAVVGAGVTSFDGGNILLGGDGSDLITGRGGDDIIDGDKWLRVRIAVMSGIGPDGGVGNVLEYHDSMTTLVSKMFSGQVNAGQLKIVRDIVTADGTGDTDVAAFSDIRANYLITGNSDGSVRVEHRVPDGAGGFTPGGIDGIDTLRNVERLRFSDTEIDAPKAPTDIRWNGVTPSNVALPAGVIANLSTLDPNGAGTFTYALLSQTSNGAPSTNSFAVSSAGVVTRLGNTLTAGNTYTLTVRATDDTGLSRVETFTIRAGTNGSETITAANGTDHVIYGGSGGNDTLTGGTGNDSIFGQQGNDSLNGGAGDDVLVGGTGTDIVNGGAGNDTIRYANNDDGGAVDGGADFDTLEITGSGIGDTIAVTLNGAGAITAFEGNSLANVEAVTVDLGGGTDTLEYTATGSVTVDLNNGAASGFSFISAIENVTGGTGADTITGDGNANTLLGGGGNDTVDGGAGGDGINGGAGNDVLRGGQNSDTITQTSTDGRDIVDGGTTSLVAGRDTSSDTYVLNGVAAAEQFRIYTRAAFLAINAGATLATGTEIVITRNGTNAASVIAELDNIEEIRINTRDVTANNGGGLDTGATAGDTIFVSGDFTTTSLNFSTITIDGNAGDDTVDISALTSAHRIVFRSNGGNDTIVGTLRAQDVIELAPGLTLADYTITTAGDVTTMTSSTNTISYVCGDEAPCIQEQGGGSPPPETPGEPLPPVVEPPVIPVVEPPVVHVPTDEVKRGGRGHDNLSGGDGHDRLYGGRGNDKLWGSDGNDRLYGEDGNDRLDGGAGHDRMEGGRGNDKYFVDNSKDVVLEKAGHGTDTVVTAGSYSLGKHVENLVLTGTGNVNGKGNGLANVLKGNDGNNGLDGRDGNDHLFGGAGNDVLKGGRGEDRMHGGSGNDTFVFQSGQGWDHVADFRNGQDKIDVRSLNVNHVSDLHLDQIGEDVMIWHGTDVLILEGISTRDLDNGDFIF